jgi:stage IV sporulation protein FB
MLGQSNRFRLFRLFGTPVFAEPSMGILILLFVMLNAGQGAHGTARGLIFGLVAVASIIVHELGHALAIRRLGYGNSVIVLHGMGGVTQWRGSATRRDRILIALAGPAAGLALGGLVYLGHEVLGPPAPTALILDDIIGALLFVNIGWSLFNLLPIWPMDGGHVVRYALASPRRPAAQALRTSLLVSMIAGGLLIVVAAIYQQIFIVVLIGFILYSNFQEWQHLKAPPPSSGTYRGY